MKTTAFNRRSDEGSLLPATLGVLLCVLIKVTEAAWNGSTPMAVIAVGGWGFCGAVMLGVLSAWGLPYLERLRHLSFDGTAIVVASVGLRKTRVALSEIIDVVSMERGALEIRSREGKIRLSQHELSRLGLLPALRALPNFRQDAVFAPNVSLWTKAPCTGAVYRKR